MNATLLPLVYDPICGVSIDDAAIEAVALAREHGRTVTTTLNDIDLVILSTDVPAEVAAHYRSAADKEYADWEDSPEGRAEKAEAAQRLATQQAAVNKAVRQLMRAKSTRSILRGLKVLMIEGDHIHIELDRPALIARLELLGFKRNDALNQPKAAYLDKAFAARWIIGQSIDHLYSGMCPHPGMIGHVEDWMRRSS